MKTLKNPKLKGFGHLDPKLEIIIHEEKRPNKKWVHKVGIRYLIWLLRRLSLHTQEVGVTYSENFVRGAGRRYVYMGEQTCKDLIESKFVFKNHKYMYNTEHRIWVSPGITAALVDAGESQAISRVIYLAAKSADLCPEIDFSVPMFTEFMEKGR